MTTPGKGADVNAVLNSTSIADLATKTTSPNSGDKIEYDPDSLRASAKKLEDIASKLESDSAADFKDVIAKAVAASKVNTVDGGTSRLVSPISTSLAEGVPTIQKGVDTIVANLRASAKVLSDYANSAQRQDEESGKKLEETTSK